MNLISEDGEDGDKTDLLRENCSCPQSCLFPGIGEILLDSSTTSQRDRMSTMRSVMPALASPPSETNDLMRKYRKTKCCPIIKERK